MANIKLKKIEYHSVHSHFTYEISEEAAAETFGSVDRFKEIISHLGEDWGGPEKIGKPPTDEEDDKLMDFLGEHDYDREEDYFSDRKGGYDITYEIMKPKNNE
tara:strand:- start:632 stop:940 length:309 start_codon:yes stop_codon:yes gene_type:complete